MTTSVLPAAQTARTLTVRYFAWVRERIGRSEERLDVPADVARVDELMRWLSARGPEYAAAFAKPDVIRTAVDHVQVKGDASIASAREIGFFPPMTGG